MISLARAGPDHPHEAGRGAHPERHAQVHLRDPELRLRGGDAKVARERQAPAAAHRVAIDRGDGGLLEVLEQRVRRARRGGGTATCARGRAGGAPPASRPWRARRRPRRRRRRRAGHDDDASRRVVAQLGEGRAQLGEHLVAQRVAAIGPVERDGGDGAVAGEEDVSRPLQPLTLPSPLRGEGGGVLVGEEALAAGAHELGRAGEARARRGGRPRSRGAPCRRGSARGRRRGGGALHHTPSRYWPAPRPRRPGPGRARRPRAPCPPSGSSARTRAGGAAMTGAASGAGRAARRAGSPAPRWSSRAGRSSGGRRATAAPPSARWARRSRRAGCRRARPDRA